MSRVHVHNTPLALLAVNGVQPSSRPDDAAVIGKAALAGAEAHRLAEFKDALAAGDVKVQGSPLTDEDMALLQQQQGCNAVTVDEATELRPAPAAGWPTPPKRNPTDAPEGGEPIPLRQERLNREALTVQEPAQREFVEKLKTVGRSMAVTRQLYADYQVLGAYVLQGGEATRGLMVAMAEALTGAQMFALAAQQAQDNERVQKAAKRLEVAAWNAEVEARKRK